MKYIIPKIIVPKLTEEEYWENVAKGKKVKPLKKSCGDCAITTGFYLELAERLKQQSKELQEKVVDSWFCHNNCNRGCEGIREFLKNK
jgi:hypothetical protein